MSIERTMQVIQEGIARRWHIGAQVYVSVDGRVVADEAVGEARPGVKLTRDTLMLWMSAGKPVTAVAIAQLWEDGKLELDEPVAAFVPEFGQNGKEGITIRHCLEHTGGFRGPMNNFTGGTWDQIVARVCAMRREPNWTPGRKAGYHVATSWFVLGEVVARLSGQPFSDYVRSRIFVPLGMPDAWIGMPPARFAEYGDRLACLPVTEKGDLECGTPANSEEGTVIARPGANLRAPARQFVRFYEMLLNKGRAGVEVEHRTSNAERRTPNGGVGDRLLLPQGVESLVRPSRVHMHDHTFGAELAWGLGFLVNATPWSESTPYLYGPHAPRRTFGHSGNQSSVAFADPEHGLACCIALNGMPGEAVHQARMREILTTLYEELGFAAR